MMLSKLGNSIICQWDYISTCGYKAISVIPVSIKKHFFYLIYLSTNLFMHLVVVHSLHESVLI